MNVFSQTEKIKQSSDGMYAVYNFGIPALETCPSAGSCAKNCYASKGRYVNFTWTAKSYQRRLELTKSPDFVSVIRWHIRYLLDLTEYKNQKLAIRIHDSGDFYNLSYALKWAEIANDHKEARFYAYTKEVTLFKRLSAVEKLPMNLTLIYSLGGIQDMRINKDTDRHARVFRGLDDLKKAGYEDASKDDTIAFRSVSNKIGLVFRGSKQDALAI